MAGRPVHPFISENFMRIDKKDNQSNRWLYDCNFCDENHAPGHNIEHQDNKLIQHIINSKACPNATTEVHRKAQIILIEKGKIIATDSVLLSLSASEESTVSEAPKSTQKDLVVKKRKAGGSMDHFVDCPLSAQEEADANVMLFR
jgi:hypothetical protein